MKICNNCKYKRRNFGCPLCTHPKAPFELNKVDGSVKPNYCSTMRMYYENCSENAMWFKPRKWYQL